MLIKSFVKRKRSLSKSKLLLLEEFLPKYKIAPKALPALTKKYDKINLEIGFGKGDFLAALALNREKECLNIGCEPYVEGVASLLQKIKLQSIENILIWPDDARLLLAELPNRSIDSIYILFPDPWPKRKQQKRRLINARFIELIAEKLKSNGAIFIATDHHEYASWALAHFKQNGKFLCEDIREDSSELFENCATRYHKKNLEGKEIRAFKFRLGS